MLEIRALYKQVPFDVKNYLRKVYAWPISVSLIACIPSSLIVYNVESSLIRLFMTVIISIVSTLFCVYYWGIDENTRKKVLNVINSKIKRRC